MNKKSFCAGISVVILAISIGAFAQDGRREYFQGTINDFGPAAVSPRGPWEVRGDWSLKLEGHSDKADFKAAFSMVRSDLWVIATAANPDDPAARTPHTHHVELHDGVVTTIPNGFRVTGPIMVTGSGNPAPFGANSTLQIDITGGSSVEFSNIKITFGGDAVGHFGTQPLEGVVRNVKGHHE